MLGPLLTSGVCAAEMMRIAQERERQQREVRLRQKALGIPATTRTERCAREVEHAQHNMSTESWQIADWMKNVRVCERPVMSLRLLGFVT